MFKCGKLSSLDFFRNQEFCFLARKKFVSDRSLHEVNEDHEHIFDAAREQKALVTEEVSSLPKNLQMRQGKGITEQIYS